MSQQTEERKWRVETVLSILSLVVSVGALAFTLWYNLSGGMVVPLKPSGYGVIRELGGFPSDHLLLPIEWANSGAKPEVIGHIYVVLSELGPNKNETGTRHRFVLLGEFPDISNDALAGRYQLKNSFVVEPHSVSMRVLVFHVERWWDKSGPQYKFRLPARKTYRVSIGFESGTTKQPERVLFEMPTWDAIDRLDRKGGEQYWWDFWTLED